jgi:hypothetical protein
MGSGDVPEYRAPLASASRLSGQSFPELVGLTPVARLAPSSSGRSNQVAVTGYTTSSQYGPTTMLSVAAATVTAVAATQKRIKLAALPPRAHQIVNP